MTDAEIDRVAWEAVCERHCHRITCDGPVNGDSTCERAHAIVRAVLMCVPAPALWSPGKVPSEQQEDDGA